jgi:hypothetical protein
VAEELADGDFRAGILAVVREVFADMSIETDGAFGYLLHHQHRSELLGDGADAEFYVGGVGDVPFAVGETVPLLKMTLSWSETRTVPVKEQHSAYWVISLSILSAVPVVSAAM